nr:proteasome assembly chaperone 1 [Arenicola marina]
MDYFSDVGDIVCSSSRAVGEEEEEDGIAPSRNVSVQWSPMAKEEMSTAADQKLACTVLIIALGPEATGFVQTYLLAEQETQTLAVLTSGLSEQDINSFCQQAPTDKTCYVQRLKDKPHFLTVMCNTPHTSPEQSFSWCEQLFSGVSLKDAIYVGVLATSAASNFKSEVAHGELPCPFLRSLHTSAFKGRPVVPCLEQPNIISGLAAQVLSHCQVHQVAAVLYMCFNDVRYVDIKTIKAFNPILTTTPLRDFVVNNPKADAQLRAYTEKHADHSLLYI